MAADKLARLRTELQRAHEILRDPEVHQRDRALLRAREHLQIAKRFADEVARKHTLTLEGAERSIWAAARSRRPAHYIGRALVEVEAVLAATGSTERN